MAAVTNGKTFARLLATGFDDVEQCLDEAAALRALGTEAEFAPDDCEAKCAFAGVVGRFDVYAAEERPQPLAVLQQFLAGARGLRVTTAESRSFDFGAHGGQHPFQIGVGQALIAVAMPMPEQPVGLLQQVAPQLFRGGRSGVDQVLEVTNQMRPAPLQLR